MFAFLLAELNSLPIAYIHTGNFDDSVRFSELNNLTMTEFIRAHYNGNLIACGGYSLEQAAEEIAANKFDLIAMGRPLIANPDLITKFRNGDQLVAYNAEMLSTLA